MAETVNAIVTASLRLLKVVQAGETIGASEAEDGRIALNDLIEEWNNQPLMQPAKTQLSQVLTSSATYTFGTGGSNSTRPVSISKAFIRSPTGGVDYPVEIISNEEYALIPLKSTSSTIPDKLYYRSGYPLGTVTLYPTPTAGYTLYLECQAALSTYDDVSDSVDLAPGYLKALKYNLAIAISPEYKDPSQVVIMEAQKSIEWIKRLNSKDKPVMFNPARAAVGYGGIGYRMGTP
jgi:hypothetical protein